MSKRKVHLSVCVSGDALGITTGRKDKKGFVKGTIVLYSGEDWERVSVVQGVALLQSWLDTNP